MKQQIEKLKPFSKKDLLHAGVGQSDHEDSYLAGQEAVSSALAHLPDTPDVLIIFGSTRFDHRKLLEGIKSVAGQVPMVGGTTAGEISTSGFSTQSVVLMALSSKDLCFTTGIGKNMSQDEAACGLSLIDDIRSKKSFEDAHSLILFPNGMGGDGAKLIQGLHSTLGSDFEIVGGYLGDDERFKYTYQYYDGKVYKDAIPGLLVSGKNSFRTGIGVRSGFESIGNRFYCTEAEGNVVKKFDGESALSLYKEFLGEERSQRLPGICLEYPFGLIDEKVSIAGKEYFQLRCGLAVDHQEDSITLAASIPEGSAITLTTASRGDIINGAMLAAKQAKDCLKGAKPAAIFMFSCVGRKLVLGRRTQEEVLAVKEILGEEVPLIGFYTYGEIGPIDKMKRDLAPTKFHNETVVLWVLGSK
jgi:hypothetical protein